jgi:hypothetical protein
LRFSFVTTAAINIDGEKHAQEIKEFRLRFAISLTGVNVKNLNTFELPTIRVSSFGLKDPQYTLILIPHSIFISSSSIKYYDK